MLIRFRRGQGDGHTDVTSYNQLGSLLEIHGSGLLLAFYKQMVWEMEVSQWSSFESPVNLTDRSSGDLSIPSSICVPLGMLVLSTMLYFVINLKVM